MGVMDEGPSVIRKLQNVYVATTHLDETVRFYRDVVGLRLKFQDAERWAQFDLDGASFAVSAAGEGSATPGAGAVVVFEVDDLDTAMSVLRGRGVQQDRWVNVLGQQYHVTGAPMDGSSIDQHNRKVYEEMVQVIKKAWTEETITHDGTYYKIPFPYTEGIQRWPAAEWTRQYGAPGEVDDQGVVRKVCVVPKPYQDPLATRDYRS